MRWTDFTGENYLAGRQHKLDEFWTLIEEMYPEDWRVDANGDLILEVDDAMLERILSENVATAWYSFGAHRGGQREDGTKFFLSRPEYLKGTYIIKGVYDPTQRFVNKKREYYFVQEGF